MPVDRAALVAGLEESLQHVVRKATVVPAPTEAAPGAWNAVQIVEHLVRTERGILRLIARMAAEPPSEQRTPEQWAVVESVCTAPEKFAAPEFVLPTGRFTTLEEALLALREVRGSTVDLVHALDVDFEAHHARHPVLGELDLAQWFGFVAAHTERHAVQLDRLR